VNTYGDRSLHLACMYCYPGNLDVVKFMVDSGADVSALDKDGYTALELLNGEDRLEIEEYVSSLNTWVKPAKR
jgi:ankyrin repeat protein